METEAIYMRALQGKKETFETKHTLMLHIIGNLNKLYTQQCFLLMFLVLDDGFKCRKIDTSIIKLLI